MHLIPISKWIVRVSVTVGAQLTNNKTTQVHLLSWQLAQATLAGSRPTAHVPGGPPDEGARSGFFNQTPRRVFVCFWVLFLRSRWGSLQCSSRLDGLFLSGWSWPLRHSWWITFSLGPFSCYLRLKSPTWTTLFIEAVIDITWSIRSGEIARQPQVNIHAQDQCRCHMTWV